MTGAPSRIGAIEALRGTDEDYLRALQERFAELDLHGVDVALDCANGATYLAGPEIFRRLGATVTAFADAPDGRNINDGCGSTHTETLAAAMRDGGHDIGFAFDGDGESRAGDRPRGATSTETSSSRGRACPCARRTSAGGGGS